MRGETSTLDMELKLGALLSLEWLLCTAGRRYLRSGKAETEKQMATKHQMEHSLKDECSCALTS